MLAFELGSWDYKRHFIRFPHSKIILCPNLRWLSGKKSSCNTGDDGSITGSRRSPAGGNGIPLPVFLPWAEEPGRLVLRVAEADMTEATEQARHRLGKLWLIHMAKCMVFKRWCFIDLERFKIPPGCTVQTSGEKKVKKGKKERYHHQKKKWFTNIMYIMILYLNVCMCI